MDHLDCLLAHDCKLEWNFHNSVWASTIFNIGPWIFCFKHTNFTNLPFSICSIYATGSYDPKAGGHLVLWECRLVIEFPPGSTVLIPSAAIAHSNIPIPTNSMHYSITQYTAEGIFRWVDHGFQTEDSYQATLLDEGCREEL